MRVILGVVKATIRTQSNISHNQFGKYAVKNGSNVISVTESPQCVSRTLFFSIFHLYGCHGDSAPLEQIGQSNSDLPLFFHLFFDCLGNIPVLATDLSGNSKADVHLKIKCKHWTYRLSWMVVQFNFSKVQIWLLKRTSSPKILPLPHVSFLCGTQQGNF